jgi:hypothetical protein
MNILVDEFIIKLHVMLFACRHIKKFGVRVNKAQDQPRAGDPVDFRAFTSDPLHRFILGVLAYPRQLSRLARGLLPFPYPNNAEKGFEAIRQSYGCESQ